MSSSLSGSACFADQKPGNNTGNVARTLSRSSSLSVSPSGRSDIGLGRRDTGRAFASSVHGGAAALKHNGCDMETDVKCSTFTRKPVVARSLSSSLDFGTLSDRTTKTHHESHYDMFNGSRGGKQSCCKSTLSFNPIDNVFMRPTIRLYNTIHNTNMSDGAGLIPVLSPKDAHKLHRGTFKDVHGKKHFAQKDVMSGYLSYKPPPRTATSSRTGTCAYSESSHNGRNWSTGWR